MGAFYPSAYGLPNGLAEAILGSFVAPAHFLAVDQDRTMDGIPGADRRVIRRVLTQLYRIPELGSHLADPLRLGVRRQARPAPEQIDRYPALDRQGLWDFA